MGKKAPTWLHKVKIYLKKKRKICHQNLKIICNKWNINRYKKYARVSQRYLQHIQHKKTPTSQWEKGKQNKKSLKIQSKSLLITKEMQIKINMRYLAILLLVIYPKEMYIFTDIY